MKNDKFIVAGEPAKRASKNRGLTNRPLLALVQNSQHISASSVRFINKHERVRPQHQLSRVLNAPGPPNFLMLSEYARLLTNTIDDLARGFDAILRPEISEYLNQV